MSCSGHGRKLSYSQFEFDKHIIEAEFAGVMVPRIHVLGIEALLRSLPTFSMEASQSANAYQSMRDVSNSIS